LALKVDSLVQTLGFPEEKRKELLASLKELKRFEQLLAFDGRLGRLTFSSLAHLIEPPFDFKKREYYPPPDPVNAVLSFSYTFFYSQLYALALSRGLDPYCGFFHKRRGVHATLSSDLIEPIRPKITAFVFSLFNGGFFKKEDFKKKGGGVVIEKEKLRELVKTLVLLDREQFLIKESMEFLDELVKTLR
jgi:CRISPR-associated protein Cas1